MLRIRRMPVSPLSIDFQQNGQYVLVMRNPIFRSDNRPIIQTRITRLADMYILPQGIDGIQRFISNALILAGSPKRRRIDQLLDASSSECPGDYRRRSSPSHENSFALSNYDYFLCSDNDLRRRNQPTISTSTVVISVGLCMSMQNCAFRIFVRG